MDIEKKAEQYADHTELDENTYRGDVVTAYVCGALENEKGNFYTEEEYDEIMSKARKLFQYRWNDIEDPYAFHKAFEWAEKQIEKKSEMNS